MSDSLEAMLAAPPAPPSHRLAYGSAAEQFVDVYLPEPSAEAAPLVVAIHGGFWRAQYDSSHLSHACAALAADGFVVASVEYRRIGQDGGGYPGTLHDVAAALARLQSEQARFGFDPRRILACGHSAGGQLAQWLAARRPLEGELVIRGVVALAPVSDLVRGHALGLGRGVIETFLGGAPEQVPPAYLEASPAAHLPLGVRQIVVHGELDQEVPLALSVDYVHRARELGDDVRLLTLLGADHYCVVNPRSNEWRQVVQALQELA